MRITLAILATVLLFGCQTMPPADSAKVEIAAVTQRWIDGMTRHDVDGVVALYDSEAVLWGTRSPTLRDKPDTVRDYFNILKTVPPSYKAVLGEQRIRIYGDVAINTGTYTFSETRDGKEVVRPSRFSFVFHYKNGRWLIIDHHSSAMPA
jgi:uncharacterized protein (TIGR02246 family)